MELLREVAVLPTRRAAPSSTRNGLTLIWVSAPRDRRPCFRQQSRDRRCRAGCLERKRSQPAHIVGLSRADKRRWRDRRRELLLHIYSVGGRVVCWHLRARVRTRVLASQGQGRGTRPCSQHECEAVGRDPCVRGHRELRRRQARACAPPPRQDLHAARATIHREGGGASSVACRQSSALGLWPDPRTQVPAFAPTLSVLMSAGCCALKPALHRRMGGGAASNQRLR
jgi:hypothetical protein